MSKVTLHMQNGKSKLPEKKPVNTHTPPAPLCPLTHSRVQNAAAFQWGAPCITCAISFGVACNAGAPATRLLTLNAAWHECETQTTHRHSHRTQPQPDCVYAALATCIIKPDCSDCRDKLPRVRARVCVRVCVRVCLAYSL